MPALTTAQDLRSDLAAVAEHYIAHTMFVEAEDCSLLPDVRDAIRRRREVCKLIIGGAE